MNSIETGSDLTRPFSRENAKELLIHKGYHVVTIIVAYQEDVKVFLTYARNVYSVHEKRPNQMISQLSQEFIIGYVATFDTSCPIFSVTRCPTRSHDSFSWKHSRSVLDFVPTKPLVKVPSMYF